MNIRDWKLPINKRQLSRVMPTPNHIFYGILIVFAALTLLVILSMF